VGPATPRRTNRRYKLSYVDAGERGNRRVGPRDPKDYCSRKTQIKGGVPESTEPPLRVKKEKYNISI